MIEASQIEMLRTSSDGWKDTERLKAHFAQVRLERRPLFLTAAEFDSILRWKLRQQYRRQLDLRAANTDELIRAVTAIALTIAHDDKHYELELRVGLLCTLRGVSVPVASAALALVLPDEYAVIDYRGWRQIFNEERRTFSISDYKRYMREIHRLAEQLGWPVQEVDLAIWEYDRQHGPPTTEESKTGSPQGDMKPVRERDLKQSETVTGKRFYYQGDAHRTLIVYPTDSGRVRRSGSTVWISSDAIDFIRAEIRRAGEIAMGACRDCPPSGSLGAKLREQGKSPQLLSYVIPLLTEEGFCTYFKEGRRYIIRYTPAYRHDLKTATQRTG